MNRLLPTSKKNYAPFTKLHFHIENRHTTVLMRPVIQPSRTSNPPKKELFFFHAKQRVRFVSKITCDWRQKFTLFLFIFLPFIQRKRQKKKVLNENVSISLLDMLRIFCDDDTHTKHRFSKSFNNDSVLKWIFLALIIEWFPFQYQSSLFMSQVEHALEKDFFPAAAEWCRHFRALKASVNLKVCNMTSK